MTDATAVKPATDEPETVEGRIKNMCSVLRLGLVIEVVPDNGHEGSYLIHFANGVTPAILDALDTSPLIVTDNFNKMVTVTVPVEWLPAAATAPAVDDKTSQPASTDKSPTVPDPVTVAQPGDGMPRGSDSIFPVEDVLAGMVASLQARLEETQAKYEEAKRLIASQQDAMQMMLEARPRVPRKEFCIMRDIYDRDLQKRVDEGWIVYHLQFVGQDQLNVVFMRIVEGSAGDSPTASAAVETPVVTPKTAHPVGVTEIPVVRQTDLIVEPVSREQRIQAAMDNPLVRAIRARGADAVINDQTAAAINAGRAYFEAHRPSAPVRPPLMLGTVVKG